jgi:hypothetical protein
MNTEKFDNDAENFIEDVKKFNENIKEQNDEKVSSEKDIKFENPLNEGDFDDDFNDDDFDDEVETESNTEDTLKIKEKEVREGIKKLIDGTTIIKAVDSIFPNTLIYLLTFIDKDFDKIDRKKIQLSEEELEIYKPIGDYVAEYIVNKLNPIVLLSGLYVYRTTLAITIEYNRIKEHKSIKLKKHKTMPLKKPSKREIKNLEKERSQIFKEARELQQIIRNNRQDYEYVKELRQELESKNAEIERLNKAIEDLRKEFLNTSQKFENPIQKTQSETDTNTEKAQKQDKRKIVSEEKRKILLERLAKAREIRKQKLQQKQNNNTDLNTTNSD